jgi:predicted lipid-binding transport protein (Tim44 family)
MFRPLSRFLVAALLTVSAAGLSVVSFDADAARAGSGKSVGSQSSNVTSKAPASTAAPSTMQKSAAAPAAGAAAGAAAKTGASKWLGPLAGIAAGLGIAALLSHFGLGGAMGDFLMVALLAGVVIFAVMFVVRMLRRGSDQPAMQGAGAGSVQQPSATPMMRETAAPSTTQGNGALSSAGFGSDAVQPEQNWFIPADFDSQRFLSEAKQQFISIQKVWDSGDVSQLRNFLTDDLMKELQVQLSGRTGTNHTEVVLLNAEMLGIEQVTDGHLASVRFSGMLREQAGAEAFRFEEVWNLFKPEQGGWLLAGIQQIPVDQAG